MEEKILQINHLSKAFGSNVVLRDIDFSVCKGDVISVIGASGSGKSTLLRCINLLETPTAGQILYRPTLIKANGGVEVVRDLVKMLCGAARPQFFHKNLELSLYYCSSHFFCRVA